MSCHELAEQKNLQKSVERNSLYFYLHFIFLRHGTVLERVKKK